MTVLDFFSIACLSIVACAVLTYWVVRGETTRESRDHQKAGTLVAHQRAIFLFDGEWLVDSNQNAKQFWPKSVTTTDWPALSQYLRTFFPQIPNSLRMVGDPFKQTDEQSFRSIEITKNGDVSRVTLELHDGFALSPESPPIEDVEKVVELAPFPIWYHDENKENTWQNRAYRELIKDGGDLPEAALRTMDLRRKQRIDFGATNGVQGKWYDVIAVELETGVLCYASDANAAIEAEKAQRNFIQALAKTFAQLPIGLAVFDRNLTLGLFNPALIDLLGVSPEFLSGRPDLFAFFDKLRDRSLMPEPKDFSSWRDHIENLIQAASTGNYQETWSLASGSVYSVSGRPHPDGAIAFQFADISAEIALTRKFRSELELGQSVLDKISDPIAVFSSDQKLTLFNSAYQDMWYKDNPPELGFTKLSQELEMWRAETLATPVWGEIRDFAEQRSERADWWQDVELMTGEKLSISVAPVQFGATMIQMHRI